MSAPDLGRLRPLWFGEHGTAPLLRPLIGLRLEHAAEDAYCLILGFEGGMLLEIDRPRKTPSGGTLCEMGVVKKASFDWARAMRDYPPGASLCILLLGGVRFRGTENQNFLFEAVSSQGRGVLYVGPDEISLAWEEK